MEKEKEEGRGNWVKERHRHSQTKKTGREEDRHK